MPREIHINPKLFALGILVFIALVGAMVAMLWPKGESISAVSSTAFAPLTAEAGSLAKRTAVNTLANSEITTPTASGSAELITSENAAVAFARAFYAVNYEDYEGWLAGLKAVSTEKGYAITEHTLVPSVWPAIEAAQTVTPSDAIQAEDKGLVLEGYSEIGGDWQIREVQVTIDEAHLWPSMTNSSFKAFLLLGQENGEWRFVSFITQEQIEQLEKGH